MLIFKESQYIKVPFNDENELEQVILSNYEYLFGPNSIYLPKALIKTGDGVGTIPDGFVIDLDAKKWYLVEAELLHHSGGKHIAPQVSKQVIASLQPITKKIIEDLAVTQYQTDSETKEKFTEQGIKEINVRKFLRDVLNEKPSIGMPIDDISEDLKQWANTLKFDVKLWKISKYRETKNKENIVYEFPEDFKPVLDTEEVNKVDGLSNNVIRYDVTIADLIHSDLLSVGQDLLMEYKPHNGEKRKYVGIIEEDGSIQILGQSVSSPSYAALVGIQDAGSDRKTVNGWTSWKTKNGQTIAELRDEYLYRINNKKEDVNL